MDIIGYEGLYKIYENGDVFSVKSNRILKKMTSSNGYHFVKLCKDKVAKITYTHKTVARHYIPNPDNKKCVDHINRDKQNNNIRNLRWVTCSENNINSAIRGKSKYRGVGFHKQKNKWRTVITIDGKSKHIGYYETEIEAAKAYNNYIIENDMNEFYLANLNVFDI